MDCSSAPDHSYHQSIADEAAAKGKAAEAASHLAARQNMQQDVRAAQPLEAGWVMADGIPQQHRPAQFTWANFGGHRPPAAGTTIITASTVQTAGAAAQGLQAAGAASTGAAGHALGPQAAQAPIIKRPLNPYMLWAQKQRREVRLSPSLNIPVFLFVSRS